jgi:hypothetical protein
MMMMGESKGEHKSDSPSPCTPPTPAALRLTPVPMDQVKIDTEAVGISLRDIGNSFIRGRTFYGPFRPNDVPSTPSPGASPLNLQLTPSTPASGSPGTPARGLAVPVGWRCSQCFFVATSRCQTCGPASQLLCEDHKKMHLEATATSRHRLDKVKDAFERLNRCKHKGAKLTHWCKTHGAMCDACQKESCRPHKCQVEPLEKESDDRRRQLSFMNNHIVLALKDVQRQRDFYDRHEAEMKEERALQIAEIQRVFGTLRQALRDEELRVQNSAYPPSSPSSFLFVLLL